MKNKAWDISRKEMIAILESVNSISSALRIMGLEPTGAHYRTIKRKCIDMGIEYDNYLNRRRDFVNNFKRRPDDEVYVENSQFFHIRNRVIADNSVEYSCAICGNNGEWQKRPMSLQLDHINGIRSDNRIENLRWLCPNCHSQTKTYAGKKSTVDKRCLDCGVKILRTSIRCNKCSQSHRNKLKKFKINWPDRPTLLQMVKDTSYSETARTLGVSDNAVRKHLNNN